MFIFIFLQNDTVSKSREAQNSSECTSNLRLLSGKKPEVRVTSETDDNMEPWRSTCSEIMQSHHLGGLRRDWESWLDLR